MKSKHWIRHLALWACLVGCAGHSDLPLKINRAEIRFQFTHAAARSVCVSGDFNGWSTTGYCMHRESGQWSLCISLPPGRYRYGFVVDGNEWIADPQGLWFETDGFGRLNAVMVVP
jgi:1,4-alpha-glucan branching enzyme